MIDLYQSELAAFAVEHRLHVIVETGLGLSTVKLLEALEMMERHDEWKNYVECRCAVDASGNYPAARWDHFKLNQRCTKCEKCCGEWNDDRAQLAAYIPGHLTSIDPEPWYDGKISHPRHTWRRGISVEVLPQLEGPWDLFLHDSDHDVFNQTFEFAFAWGMVRKGGWIACDDYTWGQHKAWQRFVEQHKLEPVKMGSIELVQKTDEPARPDKIRLIQQAEQAEREWFAKGGKNTSVFAKWRTNAR